MSKAQPSLSWTGLLPIIATEDEEIYVTTCGRGLLTDQLTIGRRMTRGTITRTEKSMEIAAGGLFSGGVNMCCKKK